MQDQDRGPGYEMLDTKYGLPITCYWSEVTQIVLKYGLIPALFSLLKGEGLGEGVCLYGTIFWNRSLNY